MITIPIFGHGVGGDAATDGETDGIADLNDGRELHGEIVLGGAHRGVGGNAGSETDGRDEDRRHDEVLGASVLRREAEQGAVVVGHRLEQLQHAQRVEVVAGLGHEVEREVGLQLLCHAEGALLLCGGAGTLAGLFLGRAVRLVLQLQWTGLFHTT